MDEGACVRAGGHDHGGCRTAAAEGLCCLPAEVMVHVLSFLTTAEDLCAVSMVCRALASVSRDESLWRRLGHPSWEKNLASTEAGWKGAYMAWLRVAAHQYKNKTDRRYVLEATPNDTQPPPAYSCTIKLLLSGPNGAGKSSIMSRCADATYSDQYFPTIGVDFKNCVAHLDGETARIQLWEAAGGERFRQISQAYYRGAHGVLVTFDLTDRSAFARVPAYLQEKLQHCDERNIGVLVGNKSDLHAQRAVTAEEAMEMAEAHGMEYVECSAKTGEGVHEAIERVAQRLAGDWRSVPGMATPNYVPAADAFFAAGTHCAPHSPREQQQPPPKAKEKKKSATTCSLQ